MKKYCRTVSILVCLFALIMSSCSAAHNNGRSARNECGIDPAIRRIFQSGSRATFDLPKYRIVTLLSIQQYKSFSRILVAIDRYGRHPSDESHRMYYSPDRGISWHPVEDLHRCQQGPSASFDGECIISNADYQTLYKQNSKVGDSFISVSHDGGKTWNDVISTISGYHPIKRMIIVETGGSRASRLYAWLKTSDESGLYVSDDYGKTLALFSKQIIYAKESKSGSTVYGLEDNGGTLDSRGLVVSTNNGMNWQYLRNAKELFTPLYRSRSSMSVQSWKRNEDDEELTLPEFPIEQIEIDPGNANCIYLRSYKGLYRSRDGGMSYELLPLAMDILRGIDKIAIDPIDGEYIFAAVNEDTIFKSGDYGCTWEKMKLPE